MTDKLGEEKKGGKARPRTAQDVIKGLHLLMVLQRTHGDDHALTAEAAKTLAGTLKPMELPLTLRFIGQALYCRGRLLPLDRKGLEQGRELGQALHHLYKHELSFTTLPGAGALRQLGAMLAGSEIGRAEALEAEAPDGISWRSLPGLEPDGSRSPLDPEVRIADLLGQATADAEALAGSRGDPWNLNRGIRVVRRLSQVRKISAFAGLRALEVAPAEWTVARRAVAGGFRALSGLITLGVNPSLARPVVHAALACCCHGLRVREGISLAKASDAALKAVLEGLSMDDGVAPPHHVRVCAILHRLRTARTMSLLGPRVTGLVHLTYEMERRRCPTSEGHDLSFSELLAQAVESGGNTYNEVWVKLMASACGEVPVGTMARLQDGSVGFIMGPGDSGDPLLPRVLVGDQVVLSSEPVELFSKAALGLVVDR